MQTGGPWALLDAIQSHEIAERVIIYGGPDFLRGLQALNPARLIDTLHLRIAAFDAVDRDATGIQTDQPGEMVEYLRSHGLHNAPFKGGS